MSGGGRRMGQTRSASPPTSKFQLRLPDADTPAMETNARNSRTQAKPCGQVKKGGSTRRFPLHHKQQLDAVLAFQTHTHAHTQTGGVLNGSPAFLLLFCLCCALARTRTFQPAHRSTNAVRAWKTGRVCAACSGVCGHR